MVVLCMIQAVSPLSYQEALELSCCAHVCFLESLNLSWAAFFKFTTAFSVLQLCFCFTAAFWVFKLPNRAFTIMLPQAACAGCCQSGCSSLQFQHADA